MEEQTSFFGVKGLFYYKISYGLGYDAAPSNESSLGIYELVDIYKNDPFSYTSTSEQCNFDPKWGNLSLES